MKLYKATGVILLLITVSLTIFLVSAKNSAGPVPGPDKESANDVKNIMGKIDARVKQVKDRLNGEFYRDHYDRDNLMFRHLDRWTESLRRIRFRGPRRAPNLFCRIPPWLLPDLSDNS